MSELFFFFLEKIRINQGINITWIEKQQGFKYQISKF